jgi:hypothetical protein
MMEEAMAKVTAARGFLQAARVELDDAVAALGDGSDNAMVTPGVLVLLHGVVVARRRLEGLELALARTRTT